MASFSQATPKERVKYLLQRWDDLKTQREPYLRRWKEISDYITPFSGRFNVSEHGDDRNLNLILSSEASRALNILASGLLAGASSPARPWFSLKPQDDDLAKNHDVALWCAEVEKRLLKVFSSSNTYNSLYSIYKELGAFGTSADIITDSYETVIEHHVLTAGEYCIASGKDGSVNTLYRNFELTVAQAVAEYGYENVPPEIQRCYDKGRLSQYFEFIQAIEPRADRDYKLKDNKNMPFASYHFALVGKGELCRESGFNSFPAICPRWECLGLDAYGTSPSFLILPDVKQLQQETLRKSELIDQFSHPPLQAPSSARQNPISMSAGAINFTSSTAPDQTIKPMISTIGDLNALRQDIAEVKQAIRDGYYVDLFLMLSQSAGDRKTTVEVYALQQEKMLVLGQVVDRNNRECLGRLVQLTYERLMNANALPAIPESLKGQALNVDFTSVLAQAQKAVEVNTVDRTFSALASASQLIPEVLDRIDPDGIVDAYQDHLSGDPRMFRSKEEAQAIREQRAQAQAQAQQMQQVQQASQSLSQIANAQRSGAEVSLATQHLDEVAMGGLL